MAKNFLHDDFLLNTKTAQILYHEYAADMPICDYHCHLPPEEIAANRRFENLTRAWLGGDHYKWRAMRADGVPEKRITGDAGDWEKFAAWAQTVPRTARNPLFLWTHLELKRYFGLDTVLTPETAAAIYARCNDLLQTEAYRARGLMERMRVKTVCTTDDPVDDLGAHRRLKEEGWPIRVLPAFRPDKVMAVEDPEVFNAWIGRLEQTAGVAVKDLDSLITALRSRHDYFAAMGCRLSDHALERPYAEDYTRAEIGAIFAKARRGEAAGSDEAVRFKSALMYELAVMNAEKDWAMQLHIGALRNINTRAARLLGPDTGYDAIADHEIARPLARFLDRLDREGRLPKTIIYTLNPKDNEVIAALTGCFQDGSVPGKIQFGSAWWFNDQKDGIRRQLEALSQFGLLSRFVGMLTDSRSFLSYPRHEYFRRLLCDLIGRDVEEGELPNDPGWLGEMVRDVSYRNAVRYFGFEPEDQNAT